jgi:pimeloyl-ACP methyl ester carboxylesterase
MQLHFQAYGAGAPLIILHGLFGSLDNWHSMSLQLGEHFHVLAIDQRNHGHSPHSSEMNYAVMAEDVSEFMRAQHIEHARVLGHSMGGKTAMQLALRNPEKVDRLVVVDIAPRAYSPRHGQIFEGALAVDLAMCQNRGDVEHGLVPFIPEKAVRQFLLKNLTRNAVGGLQWKLNLRDIFRNYGRLSEALSNERPFEKPTLFIRGEASKYLRESDWELIRHLFPRAEQRTIAHASHWVHADVPQAFLQAVLDFL